MKSKLNKLDVDKLATVSVDLSCSDIVKNVVNSKKDVYNVTIKIAEDRMPNITNLATNTTILKKRVRIFNCRTKYTFLNVQFYYNVNVFMNLFNKKNINWSSPKRFTFLAWV